MPVAHKYLTIEARFTALSEIALFCSSLILLAVILNMFFLLLNLKGSFKL